MSDSVKTEITGIRTVGVPVTDQDRALDFYVGTLGMEKRLDAPVEQLGGRWIEVAPAGSRTTGVPPMFALRDPDGNGLEIVE
ncbi:VOC family protein [Nonomuraea sp. LPB2021202275-12-8]|uniref:VOC family protein n=1 Tax=Nonomuraea sp. LPB2021202275-12-8 TaxID=3120159 RepID=UPI00300D067B